jgi:hypothetical protein
MGQRGPRGAIVERQIETTEKLTWRFTAEQLRKRLNLPGDAALSVSDADGFVCTVTEKVPLTATATVTKKRGAEAPKP